MNDPYLFENWEKVKDADQVGFSIRDDVVMVFKFRVCMPTDIELKRKTMDEAHNLAYLLVKHILSYTLYRSLLFLFEM